jgi:hypothetical protein
MTSARKKQQRIFQLTRVSHPGTTHNACRAGSEGKLTLDNSNG